MKIVKDEKNELLNRREIVASVEEGKNPGIEAVRKEIAVKLKADENALAVKSLKGKFGSNEFLIEAFVYNSAQDKERIEPKVKVKKVEGAVSAAAPAAAPAGGKK